jgi:thioredoxin reductase (NADPH)
MPNQSNLFNEASQSNLFDTTIIGAGPVGLFGSFYAGMRGMKTKIIDSLPELGGQLSTLYPEKYVFDMPGFPKVLAKDLANDMAEQGMRFQPAIALGERVEQLERQDDNTFLLTTDQGQHFSKTVIICAGAGAFAPKKLDAPGIAEFEGKGIHYFVKSKAAFHDQRLLLIGGGDSAIDWCMNLEGVAKSLTLIHRRDQFRAHEESVVWLLNKSEVDVRTFHELRSVEGDDQVRRATIYDNRTNEEATLELDGVLMNLGFNASIGPIRNWGLDLQGHVITVNSHMETNIAGVFAAGDVAQYDGKLKLIATGVGEVCIAVNYAKVYVDPSAKAFPGHSSNMDL